MSVLGEIRRVRAIIVGVGLTVPDFKPTVGTRAAVKRTVWLAAQLGARVTLVHAVDSRGLLDVIFRRRVRVCQTLPPEGRASLNALVKEFDAAGVVCDLVCDSTEPWQALYNRAIEDEADLVVVGKHDRKSSSRREFGPIPTRLLRECPCPVWAVGPDRMEEPRNILASTDLSPVGTLSTRYAACLAERAAANLHVVHYFQIPMDLQMEMGRLGDCGGSEILEDRRRRAREDLEHELETLGLRDKAKLHVACNSPSQGIPKLATELSVDLLVLGHSSRRGIQRLLSGNTAEQLVERVPCSLLAVKPEGFRPAVLELEPA